MILGFAHLAINVVNIDESAKDWSKLGYTTVAKYRGIQNPPSKRNFSERYQKKHDLFLLKGDNLWPLELTHHGITQGVNEQLKWSKRLITISVPNPAFTEQLLLEGFGFRKEENNELYRKSFIPDWSCRLKVEKKLTELTRMDAAGPTCLAFYSNRIDEDVNILKNLGVIDYTGIFDVKLGDSDMSIAMMRIPDGPILEFIKPKPD